MRIVRTVAEVRAALVDARRRGQRVGFVPTMGALHAGHVSLMRRARADADVVVVSLFVNPTQFNDASDLAAYPRTESADAAHAASAGADFLFAPSAEEMYPPDFATTVSVTGVSETLEGAVRGPAHFRGVATVVAKLLNIVQPDALYLGQKDAQQVAVLRRMVSDLNLGVHIRVMPTVRDADGLALSSRNVHLSQTERQEALALPRALEAARGADDPVGAARAGLNGLKPEYVELLRVDGATLLTAAARVGSTRLIDNVIVEGDLG